MKTLLIYPPQWNPTNPYLAMPLLAGQMKAAGFDVKTLDINVRFFNSILTGDHLRACVEKARKMYEEMLPEVMRQYPDAEKYFNSYPPEVRSRLLRFKKFDSFLRTNTSQLERSYAAAGNTAFYTEKDKFFTLDDIIDGVDAAVATLKSKTDFYDPEKLFDAKMLIQEALKIASLPYAPNEMIWDNYFADPFFNMDWVNIDRQCRSREQNMFLEYFEETADKLSFENYDLIGLSVPDLSQLIPTFTLARALKSRTGAFVAVGGNYITQNKRDFANHPEIFGEYVDALMTGDGEISLTQLASALEKGEGLDEVCGIMRPGSDTPVTFGKPAPRLKMDEVRPADFDDTDFSLYFTPEIVLPFQFSKGCYWGKCAFCDYYYGQQGFDIKTPGHAVDEMEYYMQKYGVRYFLFIDEAIPPEYYSKLADEIIRRDLRVYYYSFARLEQGFTQDVLDRMYRSGARILMWGYECSAPRLLKLMRKGINPDTRLDIMRRSHAAGIWNNALFIIGYPTETYEEIAATLDVIKKNRGFINSCTPSNFSLKKNAAIMRDAESSGVLEYKPIGEFYTVLKDKIIGISQEERREVRRQFHLDFITENQHCLWPVVYSDFDHTLLYLARYGLDYVQGYRSPRPICPAFR